MYFNESLKFIWEGRSHHRIPSIIVTKNGTVFAFCNDRKDSGADEAEEVTLVYRRKKPGCDWEAETELEGYEGWACHIGSASYSAETDEVMVDFGRSPITTVEWKEYTDEERAKLVAAAEEKAAMLGVKRGSYIKYTRDGGETWLERDHIQLPAKVIHTDGKEYTVDGGRHGGAHAITLKYGEHKGRIIAPSRFGIGSYTTHEEIKHHTYNNALYSDDNGLTWQSSQPVQIGTGEGALIERGDGSLLYNSRAYYQDGKRRMAVSRDGGETWGEFYEDEYLLEDTFQGVNAAFLRVAREDIKDAEKYLPEGANSVTLFTNPRSEKRENMCISVSFDEGATYVKSKSVWAGPASYSSIDFNAVDQRFYLMYEIYGSRGNGIMLTEFDLEWLMKE